MRYPSLSNEGFPTLVRRRIAGEPVDVGGEAKWLGDGDDVDLAAIDRMAAEVHELVRAQRQRERPDHPDAVEGGAAGVLHRTLSSLPTAVLDDPGFWRFLSVGPLWEYVHWRERGAFDSGEPSKYLKYVDGRVFAECVALRTYLRGAISAEDGDYSLSSSVPRATDFWRSHIVRVRTGSAPTLARAVVRSQRDDRMATTDLREFAKRLNRTWTNVVLYTYDDEESDRLVRELRDS